MIPFKPEEADFKEAVVDGKRREVMSKARFDRFSPHLLGAGDLTQGTSKMDAVVALFQLADFPEFSRKAASDFTVPFVMKEFLFWVVDQIKRETKRHDYFGGVILWGPLPLLVKFTGEGVLAIWNATDLTEVARRNIMANSLMVCGNYRTDFIPRIYQKVPDVPGELRCALACGTVYTLGDGSELVGGCISTAERLLRLRGVGFSFAAHGFNVPSAAKNDWVRREIILRRVIADDISDAEVVGVLRSEMRLLNWREKRQFKPLK